MDELLGDKRTLVQFLETLSLQLSGVIERQRFAERERSQQAMMLASSNLSSLGEMAAGVAHEINNPLTAILLGSTQARQLASKSEPDLAALGRILERIERSAERIGKIVSGMRTLSRDGSGDPFVPVQATAILEDTLSICSTRFRNAGIELGAPGEGVSGLALQCRPVQVSQVLLNLLNNAFDAVGGQQGPWVRIEVAAVADPDGRQWVEMAVLNSGPKISRDLAQQVMRPFFTTKPVGKGTGLGLSIARSIAEVHGGSLTLDLSGEHTRFVLKLKRDLSTS
jgi:C4-dicarboxylate-specific signal transduction histidine kinase